MMAGWTMGPDGWLWMAAWILAIAFLVWLLVRPPGKHKPERDEALDLLRARLAWGEISPEEFERARRLLES